MNVLLICAVPDPREHPRWAETADVVGIREAVRGLCRAVTNIGGTLFVPPQPAIVALVRTIVPAGNWAVVDDVRLLAASGVWLHCAFLVGGTNVELATALAVRAAGTKVYPIASAGGAAIEMLRGCPEFTPVDRVVLEMDMAYGAVFETILSL